MPLFPLVCEDPLTPWHEILSRNTRDSRLSYGENLKSLSYLVFNWYWVVTHRRDRITIADTRYS